MPINTSHVPPTPYTGAREYFRLRPTYNFGGATADDTAVAGIHRLLTPSDAAMRLADCGPGAGQIWPRLDPRITEIVAIEPNAAMHNSEPDPRARYIVQDGLEFLATDPEPIDLISWMWSLNYAVLQHFERYDAVSRRVVVEDWGASEPRAVHALQRAFARLDTARLFVMFFDSDSIEQQFVTDIWSTVAPFPFNQRKYTRELAFGVIAQIAEMHNRDFHVEHRVGVADYGSQSQAVESLLGFHLRGHFDNDDAVVRAVRRFCEIHDTPAGVHIPAGVFLCWVR